MEFEIPERSQLQPLWNSTTAPSRGGKPSPILTWNSGNSRIPGNWKSPEISHSNPRAETTSTIPGIYIQKYFIFFLTPPPILLNFSLPNLQLEFFSPQPSTGIFASGLSTWFLFFFSSQTSSWNFFFCTQAPDWNFLQPNSNFFPLFHFKLPN